MQNDLGSLNNYLFECIERITDDELNEEQLDKEIKRCETVQKVAKTIIDNGTLALQAQKHFDEYGKSQDINIEMPLFGNSKQSLNP